MSVRLADWPTAAAEASRGMHVPKTPTDRAPNMNASTDGHPRATAGGRRGRVDSVGTGIPKGRVGQCRGSIRMDAPQRPAVGPLSYRSSTVQYASSRKAFHDWYLGAPSRMVIAGLRRGFTGLRMSFMWA